jgi:prephenate dehydratase
MRVRKTSTQPSPDLQQVVSLRAVYQGTPGAFGEEAIRSAWHGRAHAIPARSFSEAFDEVLSGRVACAVIPVWNSTIGEIAPAQTALRARGSAVVVAREISIPVRHCLLGLAGTSLTNVRFVGSHSAALAQCAKLFVAHPEWVACNASDTAGAAYELSLLRDPARTPMSRSRSWYASLPVESPTQLAVLASVNAGKKYGLCVLRENVQDDPANVTRFVIVRAKESQHT